MDISRRDIPAALAGIAALAQLGTALPAAAQGAARPRMATNIPEGIAVPNRLETRVGTFEFFDGVPLQASAQRLYDIVDLSRGIQAYLRVLPAASLSAMRAGLKAKGCVNNTIGIFETLMDSRTLFLTANTDSIYTTNWLDLSEGPLVIESPPNVLGFINTFWFDYVCDIGNAGPDQGRGGKYLLVPPGYDRPLPEGYHTFRTPTVNNWLAWRGFQVNRDPRPAVESIKAHAKIYRLDQAANPPPTRFVNLSGVEFNTIHRSDDGYFHEVDEVVQAEPAGVAGPEVTGLLAAIGIVKGQRFAPDDRMKRILHEAAAIGNGASRAMAYSSRDPRAPIYPNSQWVTPFIGGSYEFLHAGARLFDPLSFFFFYATGITPAMTIQRVGLGSQYLAAMMESPERPFDGGKTYRLHLPPNIPAKDFWSLTIYDTQTRSMLQTDAQFPGIGTYSRGIARNPDGSIDLFVGPRAPAGKERNWVQTIPGKSWTAVFRLYGPLQPFFDKAWRPGEFERLD